MGVRESKTLKAIAEVDVSLASGSGPREGFSDSGCLDPF